MTSTFTCRPNAYYKWTFDVTFFLWAVGAYFSF